jgi:hypothetical protein
MNSLSGVNEPYSINTLDGLDATSTLIASAVGAYLPLTGGTLSASGPVAQVATSGTTRLGIASDTQGTVEFTNTAGASKAFMFYTPGNNDVSFTVGTNTRVLRVGGTQITSARNISMATTNKVINMSPGTTANDAVNYGQTMLRSGVNAATANIPMGGFKLTGLGLGVAGDDAATVSQLTASPYFYLPLAGGTMTGNLVINRGVNPCIFTLASAGNTTIHFKDDNLVLKGSMQYNQPANSLHFDLAGVTRQSISTTAATFSIPVAMSSQKITGLLAGAGGSTDAANVAQMETADLLKLSLSGGTMTGTIVSNTITNPFNFFNSTGPLTGRMSAGQISVTNSCTLQMCSNSSSILDFQDNTNTTKAQFKYTYGSPGTLNMVVNGTTILSATDTEISTKAINVNGQRVYGLNATPSTDTDAVPRLYMANADAAVVASSLQKSGGTMTGDITFSSGNINMGTGYIGLQAGVAATDAVNKGQLDTKTYLQTSSTSNGSLTIADPSSSLTTLTFRNAATLFSSPIGTCQFITEALSQLWIKANVTTHAKESGIQLDAGTFIFFTGDPSSATTRFSYDATATNEMNIYGTLNMRTHKVSNVVAGTVSSDCVNYGQTMLLSGVNTMTGGLNMGSFQISAMANGTGAQNAVTYSQTMLLSGVNSMTGSLNMGTQKIINLLTPTLSTDAVTKAYTDTKAYLRTTANSNGTLTMTDPASNTTFLTLRNGYSVLGTQLGLTHLAMEGVNHYITHGDPDTHVVKGGIEINTTGFTYFTGTVASQTKRFEYVPSTGFKVNGATVLAGNLTATGTTTLNGNLTVNGGTITRNTWAAGETVSRHFQSPALGQSLVTLSVAVGATEVIMSTAASYYPIAVGNRLLIVFGCSCDAAGYGSDKFDIILNLGPTPTVKTFPYVLGPSTSYRDRYLLLNTLYIVENIGVTQVEISLFNDSDDTITLDNTNWHFSVEEIKA